VNYIAGSEAGTVGTIVYEDITIKLSSVDKGFGERYVRKGNIIVPLSPMTMDGGKTWMLSRIEFPPITNPLTAAHRV
jgi:hypothetical protein